MINKLDFKFKIIAAIIIPILVAVTWMVYSTQAQDGTTTSRSYFEPWPSPVPAELPVRFHYFVSGATVRFGVALETNQANAHFYDGQYLGSATYGFTLSTASLASGNYVIIAEVKSETGFTKVAYQKLLVSATTNYNTTNNSTDPIQCVFTYSDWGLCQNNIQTRQVLTKLPANCNVGVPEYKRDCTMCTADVWQCGQWSACSTAGYKNRVCALITDCPTATNTEILSQQCTEAEMAPPTTNNECQYKLSDWNTCLDGKQQRTILERYPEGCTAVSIETLDLERSCTYNTTTTTANNIHCQYKLSDWNACSNGKQQRTVLERYPAGCLALTAEYPALSRACTEALSPCVMEDWECNAWGKCFSSGVRYRDCKLIKNCQTTDATKPIIRETCQPTEEVKTDAKTDNKVDTNTNTNTSTNTNTETAQPKCLYRYSAWTECSNNQQYRQILPPKPTNCVGNPESLSRKCTTVDTCQTDEWKCSEWSPCAPNQQSSRSCELVKDCPRQTTVRPAIVRGCEYQKPGVMPSLISQEAVIDNRIDNQYKPEALSPKLTQPVTEAPVVNISESQPETTRQLATQAIETKIPNVCSDAGLIAPRDCEMYLRQTQIVGECLVAKIVSKTACREYFFNKYGKPLKCRDLTEEQCLAVVDSVILGDWRDQPASLATRRSVETIIGTSATFNSASNNITVNQAAVVPSTGAKPEAAVVSDVVKVDVSPFAPSVGETKVFLASAKTDDNQSILLPAVLMLDNDGDGLPNDIEKRLGTNPDNRDTDGDGYDDATEVRTGNDPLSPAKKKLTTVLNPVDQAVVFGRALEQPKFKEVAPSQSLKVTSIMTTNIDTVKKTSQLSMQGVAKPNQVVTIYIYSVMPIVVTVVADANGNWVYDLDKTLIDGKHEVYVAVNDDQGRIQETSNPAAFLVKEAKAVSLDEFVQIEDATYVPSAGRNIIIFYTVAALALITSFVVLFLVIRRKINA